MMYQASIQIAFLKREENALQTSVLFSESAPPFVCAHSELVKRKIFELFRKTQWGRSLFWLNMALICPKHSKIRREEKIQAEGRLSLDTDTTTHF